MTSNAAGIGLAGDPERAIVSLVMAFSADPIIRWVYPDSQQYAMYFPGLIRLLGGKAFEHGTSHQTADYRGVALWLPPGVHYDAEALGAFAQSSVAPADQEAVFGVLEQLDDYHPKDEHWYLPLIGVDPPYQGKGYGSALLRHTLAECDGQHLPAYLESSNPRNNPLYERHGFEIMGVIESDDSPPLWPMLRKAR